MKWAAKLLVVTLALAGSQAIFLSSPSCCPMGGNMACCLAGASSDGTCALRSCGGRDDSAAVFAASPRAILRETMTLPEPSLGVSVSKAVEPFALSRSDAPPAPPPRA